MKVLEGRAAQQSISSLEISSPRENLDGLLEFAAKGVRELIAYQPDIVGQVLPI